MSKEKESDINEEIESSEEEADFLDQAEWEGLVHSFGVLYPQSEHKTNSKLTRKQKLVAYAISLGWEHATISKLAGNVHRNTIANWLKNPDFTEFLNACAYTNPIAKVNDYIKSRLIGVAKRVADIAESDDPNIKTETKLDAQKTLLKQALGDPEQTKTITIRDLYNKFDSNKRDVMAEDIAKLEAEEERNKKTH